MFTDIDVYLFTLVNNANKKRFSTAIKIIYSKIDFNQIQNELKYSL